jgi:hypothetical protein
MFVQVIQGRTDDDAGLRRQMERWRDELQAGAKGYLGSTFGVTADGEAIGIVRFESPEAAAANSGRPEQGQWWAQTEKLLSGPATFHDTSEVDISGAGGSDDAGFVQVMQGRIHDLDAARKLEEVFMKEMPEKRPDVIGSIRARYGDGEFSEFIYFTSEAEARQGEKKMDAEAAGDMAEWERTMSVDRYFDLTDPWLYSP